MAAAAVLAAAAAAAAAAAVAGTVAAMDAHSRGVGGGASGRSDARVHAAHRVAYELAEAARAELPPPGVGGVRDGGHRGVEHGSDGGALVELRVGGAPVDSEQGE